MIFVPRQLQSGSETFLALGITLLAPTTRYLLRLSVYAVEWPHLPHDARIFFDLPPLEASNSDYCGNAAKWPDYAGLQYLNIKM